MFQPGLEPGTFRVWGERDNHYTTETVKKVGRGLRGQLKHLCTLTSRRAFQSLDHIQTFQMQDITRARSVKDR